MSALHSLCCVTCDLPVLEENASSIDGVRSIHCFLILHLIYSSFFIKLKCKQVEKMIPWWGLEGAPTKTYPLMTKMTTSSLLKPMNPSVSRLRSRRVITRKRPGSTWVSWAWHLHWCWFLPSPASPTLPPPDNRKWRYGFTSSWDRMQLELFRCGCICVQSGDEEVCKMCGR